ncbi:OX-2 membrane glycoprotein-like [Myxocyprinus asiaticus]|uniref:OX-2 membrane glycoprotein-like n=1 Tax=Myxocyprinus asiaticus TaxID=70543 RepID=UPI00222351B7|nr:OX-2 membrane glycoprotein-like [Myxocyprinus asiaticus]
MLRFLIILSLLRRAYLSDIISNGDTAVLFGEDAKLSCTLPNASGVKQVTWQRVRADERVQTLATFSERFKEHVDYQYVGKVSFTVASFNSTSIVIKNVTFEDEACYICSFKVYPIGPKRETLCLTIKGISKITATLNSAPNSDVKISCSATGKPTPTLHWKSTEKELNLRLNNFTVLSNDSSSTVTSNLTLPMSHFQGKYVECLAQSGTMESSFKIYVPGEENNATLRNYIITIVVLIIVCVVITAIYIYTKINDSKEVKTSASTA